MNVLEALLLENYPQPPIAVFLGYAKHTAMRLLKLEQ